MNSGGDDDDLGVQSRLHMLVDDVRNLAEAEIAYYRARFAHGRAVAKRTGLFVAITLFMLMGSIFSLILGLLLILTEYVGPIGATMITTIIFGALTLLFAQLARRSSRDFAVLDDDND